MPDTHCKFCGSASCGCEEYRRFGIRYELSMPSFGRWTAFHEEWDGTPDEPDSRYCYAPTRDALLKEIDEWWEGEGE